jgi:hypothetical protein
MRAFVGYVIHRHASTMYLACIWRITTPIKTVRQASTHPDKGQCLPRSFLLTRKEFSTRRRIELFTLNPAGVGRSSGGAKPIKIPPPSILVLLPCIRPCGISDPTKAPVNHQHWRQQRLGDADLSSPQ